MRAWLRGALAARLLSDRAGGRTRSTRRSASTAAVRVTVLPRTGTTALHGCSTADPAHQGLDLLLAERRIPGRPGRPGRTTRSFQYIQAGCERTTSEHPEFHGVHTWPPTRSRSGWQLLAVYALASGECLAPPAVLLRPAARPGLYLGVTGVTGQPAADRAGGGRRWVLKKPQHLVALERAAAVYPDGADRADPPPPSAIASVCSLAAQATAGCRHVRRRGVAGTSWNCGRPGSSDLGPNGPGMTPPVFSTFPTATGDGSGRHRRSGLRGTSAAVRRRRAADAIRALGTGSRHRRATVPWTSSG